VGPTSEVIARLTAAGAAPTRRDGSPDVDALPRVFRDWLPVAWSDLRRSLRPEGESGEVVGSAEQQFRARLRAVFKTVVALQYAHRQGTEDREQVQRRPVIDWCRQFGRTSRWGDVRGLDVWAKTVGGRLVVAFRATLIGQLHVPGWGVVDHEQLSLLCRTYNVGSPCRVKGGLARAVQLTDEFVADLLDAPADDADDPNPDTRTANPRHAREGEGVRVVRVGGEEVADQGLNHDTEPGHPVRVDPPGVRVPGSGAAPNPDTPSGFDPSNPDTPSGFAGGNGSIFTPKPATNTEGGVGSPPSVVDGLPRCSCGQPAASIYAKTCRQCLDFEDRGP
jgi:hypothetical protein